MAYENPLFDHESCDFDPCDYHVHEQSYTQKCIELGEHFKMVASSGGYDVCFNCGAKE